MGWKSVKGTDQRMGQKLQEYSSRPRERKRDIRVRVRGQSVKGMAGRVTREAMRLRRRGRIREGNELRQLISPGFHNALANERPL